MGAAGAASSRWSTGGVATGAVAANGGADGANDDSGFVDGPGPGTDGGSEGGVAEAAGGGCGAGDEEGDGIGGAAGLPLLPRSRRRSKIARPRAASSSGGGWGLTRPSSPPTGRGSRIARSSTWNRGPRLARGRGCGSLDGAGDPGATRRSRDGDRLAPYLLGPIAFLVVRELLADEGDPSVLDWVIAGAASVVIIATSLLIGLVRYRRGRTPAPGDAR